MDKKFVIVTDSGADLDDGYCQKNAVVKIPLAFTLDGVTYDGEKKMPTEEFYAKLKNGGMPVTHQATPEGVKEVLREVLKGGRDVLAIAFSSGLSGTANSYLTAKKQLEEEFPKRKIAVVDSLCASMGQGLLVDYAVRYLDEGKTLEETAAYLESLKEKIAHSFTVDNLYHLKRGGRVSGVAAFIGTILKIKPVMHVNDEGKLVVLEKCMGRKKALQTMLERIQKGQALRQGDPIFISHGNCLPDAEEMKKALQEKYPDNPILIGEIGPVIGSHSGVGTLAIFYLATAR